MKKSGKYKFIDKMVRKRLKIDFSDSGTSLSRNLAYELSFHKDVFQVSDISALYLFYYLNLVDNQYELEVMNFDLDKIEAQLTEEAQNSGYRTNDKTKAFIRRDPEWINKRSEIIKQTMQTKYIEGIVTAFVIKADIAKMFTGIPHDGNIPIREILNKITDRAKFKSKSKKGR